MAKVVLGIGRRTDRCSQRHPTCGICAGMRTGKIPSTFIAANPTTFQNCSRRGQPGFAASITPEERKKRYDRCQSALDKLAAKFAEVKPDAVVMIGNDQRELSPTTIPLRS